MMMIIFVKTYSIQIYMEQEEKNIIITTKKKKSLDESRGETPHVDTRIHLNAAGCSLPSTHTLDAVHQYLDDECRLGGYEAAQKDDLGVAYTELAKLLNCDATEIAIVTSATEAWLQVVYGLAFTIRCILTSISEYGSNFLTYLQIQKRLGVEIVVIPETPDGCIDLDFLEEYLKNNQARPVLVSITHIPTSSGKVYDAAAVGALAKRYGALYLLDACQSIGQRDLDVRQIQCDMLTGTGRKFLRAPRGSGFLYCSSNVMTTFEPGTIDVASAQWLSETEYEVVHSMRRFEKYEMSYAAKIGLGVAVQECNTYGIHAIQRRIEELATHLRSRLRDRLGSDIQIEDRCGGSGLCGIVSFSIHKPPHTVDTVYENLQRKGVSVSVSRRGSTLLDFRDRNLQSVIRSSCHVYNTMGELEIFVAHLYSILHASE